jgi:RNA polymerase sigma-70 factor (ECF subfamily)
MDRDYAAIASRSYYEAGDDGREDPVAATTALQEEIDTATPDLELARQVAAGDSQALEVFYQRYFTRLYRFVYYQVGGSHDDAQDVLQDTLVAALKSLPSFRGDSTLYSWLCGVAWNKAADFRRREYRMAQVEQRSVKEVVESEMLTSNPSPDNALLHQENQERVHETLEALPEHYRQVLVLKYAEGLPVADIAQIMRRTFKSTESLLTRARSAFRESYATVAQ